MFWKRTLNDVVYEYFWRFIDSDKAIFVPGDCLQERFGVISLYCGPRVLDNYPNMSLALAFCMISENILLHGTGQTEIITKGANGMESVCFINNSKNRINADTQRLNRIASEIIFGKELEDDNQSDYQPRGTQIIARCIRQYKGSLHYSYIGSKFNTTMSFPL